MELLASNLQSSHLQSWLDRIGEVSEGLNRSNNSLKTICHWSCPSSTACNLWQSVVVFFVWRRRVYGVSMV